ncbi:MAG: dihydromonapterin reductase [Coxiella sp. RIFCSPHIGHO2_12_FULL_44_14]|nr:MAG: dihydromonapterin reductase [Coxiella sp. RIFCSPHIGHO2_12_FULL_44_14]
MNTPFIKPLIWITSIIAIALVVWGILRIPRVSLPKPVTISTVQQPTLGSPTASVHIVAFEDLKCGNCQRYTTTLFPTIKKEYIDTGIVQYTIVLLAFIPGSIPAANAALCLYHQNPSYFFPFVDYLYQHQPSEETDWATIATLLQFAQASVPKADQNTLSNCIFTGQYTDTLNNNLQLAGKVMTQIATPTIYVNGVIVQPLTLERMRNLINAAREKN